MAVLVTLDDVRAILDRTLSNVEVIRAQQDLDAVHEVLEGWLGRTLANDETVTDERHVAIAEVDKLQFNRRPVKSVVGVRYDLPTNELITDHNDHFLEPLIPRGTVYYVTYVVDGGEMAKYTNTLKRVILAAVIHPLLKPDTVRYGVISNYSVEGLSITYNTPTANDDEAVGVIPGTDLRSLSKLRRRVW
jgi:hypothetical protein